MPRYPVFSGGVPAAMREVRPRIEAFARSKNLTDFRLEGGQSGENTLTLTWTRGTRSYAIHVWGYAREGRIYLRVYRRIVEGNRCILDSFPKLAKQPGFPVLSELLESAYQALNRSEALPQTS